MQSNLSLQLGAALAASMAKQESLANDFVGSTHRYMHSVDGHAIVQQAMHIHAAAVVWHHESHVEHQALFGKVLNLALVSGNDSGTLVPTRRARSRSRGGAYTRSTPDSSSSGSAGHDAVVHDR